MLTLTGLLIALLGAFFDRSLFFHRMRRGEVALARVKTAILSGNVDLAIYVSRQNRKYGIQPLMAYKALTMDINDTTRYSKTLQKDMDFGLRRGRQNLLLILFVKYSALIVGLLGALWLIMKGFFSSATGHPELLNNYIGLALIPLIYGLVLFASAWILYLVTRYRSARLSNQLKLLIKEVVLMRKAVISLNAPIFVDNEMQRR